jgi:hypothetical protein
MSRSVDNGERGQSGVVLSIRRTDAGVEVTMDDVLLERAGPGRDRLWRHDAFVTFADVSREQLSGAMTDEDLKRFGQFVFGAIAARTK